MHLKNRSAFSGFILILLSTLSAGTSMGALELSLNGRVHAIPEEDVLTAFAQPDAEGRPSVPLQSLFPWMKTVRRLDGFSGGSRLFRDEESLTPRIWQDARLVRNGENWSLHVGMDVFFSPNALSLTGTPLIQPAQTLRFAVSAMHRQDKDDGFTERLKAALSLRGLTPVVENLKVTAGTISSPEDLPLMMLIPEEELVMLMETGFSQVESFQAVYSRPVATGDPMWAYTALAAVAEASPDLKVSREALSDILQALLGPSTDEKIPSGMLNLRLFAVIPSGLTAQEMELANALVQDALRTGGYQKNARHLNINRSTYFVNFINSFNRVAPLLSSGVMDSDTAAEIMMSTINGAMYE